MTRVSYEIRTSRNAAVFRFDCRHRALEELKRSSERLKTQLRLVEIREVEEEITP